TKGFHPNPLGGRENLPAIRFLRELNTEIRQLVTGAVTIAEESTAFPKVCTPQNRGGLGFSMKWDMGWVNDTLRFMGLPWSERPAHHRNLNFGRTYAEKERFVLSFSHDEVMPGKGSLFHQMYGDEAQKFAGLRLLACYQFTYPGKKLSFMGNEFGQRTAWDGRHQLVWEEIHATPERGISTLPKDLNALYCRNDVLSSTDFSGRNFEWIEPDDAEHSTIAYLRRRAQRFLIVVLNFSPLPLRDYIVAAPRPGPYGVLLDSDASQYGGSGGSRLNDALAKSAPSQRFEFALSVSLAPLTCLIIAPR
ncbi:MAG: alpha amylase C-terminal domain-containing protein, partial [Candidatus Eremiobacteraeota bacterium]|nr:alpha amylase C-terminal domain-containing protein [Candidatus Eremiobacteraeota bacterium]